MNGASGGVGAQAVQIAKVLGAQVTAVCSEKNFPFVQKLGAKKVLDYRKSQLDALSDRYSLLFDSYAHLSYFKMCKIILHGGRFVTLLPSKPTVGGVVFGYAAPTEMYPCDGEIGEK